MTRILLVEDEESYRAPLAYRLEKDGFEVVQAATGPDAVEAFAQGAPTWCCSTSCFPGWTAPRCAASCAAPATSP
ncbi:hypothetical protein GCM10025875_24260 [Litorihabitans aurantiacus]|uniref:Response regulatory domain-containing protein n=1 Tax=Litorihabitans aurantiacus TaxID=1930061 RepID=A0AA37XG29_9MICO|nr:hypothetical protein GCM10025875_24260 [Litorihabitans aurantiacus]